MVHLEVMNKENKIYFLLPTKEYKIYDYASSVLENYGNDEKLYLLGIFAFRFKKGEEYTIEYAVELANKLMKEGLSASSAAKQAAEITGKRKNEIYRQLI